jgi:hypothetical protein
MTDKYQGEGCKEQASGLPTDFKQDLIVVFMTNDTKKTKETTDVGAQTAPRRGTLTEQTVFQRITFA